MKISNCILLAAITSATASANAAFVSPNVMCDDSVNIILTGCASQQTIPENEFTNVQLSSHNTDPVVEQTPTGDTVLEILTPLPFVASATITNHDNVSTVPLPPAIWLFGIGLIGIAGIARRKA